MILTEVRTSQDEKDFLQLPLRIYKDDPNYIRPLDADVSQVFDKEKNKYYDEENCIRWVLKDDQGMVIGRIAAFINPLIAYSFEQPTGGLGFFECVNDRRAAFILFDAAKSWLKAKGMEAMDGPINLGDRDKWWGLLVDGFHPPCYCSNYNPDYYKSFFDEYGFCVYFQQYTYYRKVHEPLKPLHYAIAERVKRSPDYAFKHIGLRDLDKYVEDFRQVYNKAWLNHDGVGEMSFEQARQIVTPLKPVIDERIIWFAYYKNEPVGFFVSIPELNQLFVKYVDGELNTFGKLRLLFNKWTGSTRTMFGLVFGIVPEHQKKGVEIAMIVEAHNAFRDKVPYNDIQMNWIGDFNPRMMAVAEQIGAEIYKTHHTYRYLFDREKEFERHPEI
ncbi:hypothetical protein [Pedobacter sp. SYSU D00535]|uniref:hypothetical protein n=1 Tax=Pedobacter sp. SYSU D00535 TaxID=2810308 RepID=UPI001A978694|nr:hypothetical protein [Pedobacter sp. SYSU D00535]